MKPAQYCLTVVTCLCVACTWAWMSNTCLVLDEASPFPRFHTWYSTWCARGVLTAVCVHVSDVKLDLSGIPTDIQVLCLKGKSRLVLQPDIFTRFHSLRSIYIQGHLTAVLSGAFRGLTNLLLLSMVSPRKTNVTFASKAFDDLHSLEELTLKNYALSGMAPDVFDGLGKLRRLDVSSPDEKFSELLCRLVNVSMSLKALRVTMGEVETLEASNCSAELSEFPALQNISISFPNIKQIGRDALKYFKRISELSMPMNDLLHTQLLELGIQRVDRMILKTADLNVTCVCKIALALNVTDLRLKFSPTQEPKEGTAWEDHQSQDSMTLMSQQHLPFINLSFIHTLKSLKKLRVSLAGGTAEKVDESLSSLCGEQTVMTVGLTAFSYKTDGQLSITPRLFTCLGHLEHLHINTYSTVKTEDFAFEGLYKLRSLVLWPRHDSAKRNTLALASFEGLDQVQTLYLQALSSPVQVKYFKGLCNLHTLTICCGSVQNIEDFAFRELKKLRHLDLGDNRISVITANTFSGLRELQTLFLNLNPLKNIGASAFRHFPSLQILSLGYLRFPVPEHGNMQVLNLSLIFGTFPDQLADLSITSVHSMTLVITDDSAPKVDLKLSLSAQQILLMGCERRFVKSVTHLYVTAEQFLCGPVSTSALGHFTSVQQLQFTHVSVSTGLDLSGLNRLVHLKRLDLQKVNFFNLPHISVIFQNLTKLESLSLYNCWADSLEGSLTVDLTPLKYLELDIMSETSMTEAFFEPLSNLKCVIIYQFQLRCNCENAWFDGWAKQQSRVEVFLFSSQQRALQCQSGGRLEELERFGQEHCSLDVGFVLFVSTASFLLLFMLAVLLQQLASDYLLAFFHIAGGWLDEALHRNTRRRYLYDAFVSYSGRDERWVVEQLLPSLERRGPPFLRLCLHSRDFQLGKDVVENITDSLYRSRRTLCLISRHFLRSNWCSLELRLATYRLQVERRDVLILLFLEEIPSPLLSAHHRLARLLKTRTYINWPQDPVQQEAFWDRLWGKLASQGQ